MEFRRSLSRKEPFLREYWRREGNRDPILSGPLVRGELAPCIAIGLPDRLDRRLVVAEGVVIVARRP